MAEYTAGTRPTTWCAFTTEVNQEHIALASRLGLEHYMHCNALLSGSAATVPDKGCLLAQGGQINLTQRLCH